MSLRAEPGQSVPVVDYYLSAARDADRPARDLAAVGDQDLGEHGLDRARRMLFQEEREDRPGVSDDASHAASRG